MVSDFFVGPDKSKKHPYFHQLRAWFGHIFMTAVSFVSPRRHDWGRKTSFTGKQQVKAKMMTTFSVTRGKHCTALRNKMLPPSMLPRTDTRPACFK